VKPKLLVERLGLVLGLAFVTLFVVLSGLGSVRATGDVDMQVTADAPAHVAMGSSYLVRLSYYNYGTQVPSDAWVTATLPSGVTFISATDRWGEPLPPDAVGSDTLSWYFVHPSCQLGDANCGHILLTVQADIALAEGTVLTTSVVVATSDVESDLTNNTASATSEVCEMAGSVKQVQRGLALPGDVLTYTIAVNLAAQSGPGERWVTVSDTLPFSHQVRFLGWHGDVTGTLIDGHMLQWQGRVAAGHPLLLQYRMGVEGDVTPGELITNAAMLQWAGRQLQLGPVTTVVTLPHGMLGLGPYQGGQLQHRYGVTLTVPPGAVTDTTRFECHPMTQTHVTPPGGLMFANRAFEMKALRFGEPVGQFNAPLTVTIHYSDTDVVGLKRETLRLWARSGPEAPWLMLGEPLHVAPNTLTFTTTHFSEFALFGEAMYTMYLPLALRHQ